MSRAGYAALVDDELDVWLETGYDQGRTGAWMLAWPGCFTWASDRDAVVERAGSAVGAHLDWLAEHGEPLPLLESGRPRVVEEVPVERDGAYERSACFQADRRPVDARELETLLQRARWARNDLLATVGRARTLPDPDALHGRPRSAEHATAAALLAPRSLDEVLRHVGQAEVWFTSRLERGARYAGPPAEGDLGTYLTATRAWFEGRIRDLQARDPAAAATDGKGEAWTLFKVLRRFVYHGLDHLEELDRRLALAEGRASRLPGGAGRMWPPRIWPACSSSTDGGGEPRIVPAWRPPWPGPPTSSARGTASGWSPSLARSTTGSSAATYRWSTCIHAGTDEGSATN